MPLRPVRVTPVRVKNNKPTRRKPRHRPCPPPPGRSGRLYVRVLPRDIAMFRFLLEAHDNLGIFTVTDRFQGILMLRYSPHQEREIKAFLHSLKGVVPVSMLHEAPEPRVG